MTESSTSFSERTSAFKNNRKVFVRFNVVLKPNRCVSSISVLVLVMNVQSSRTLNLPIFILNYFAGSVQMADVACSDFYLAWRSGSRD